MRISFDPAKRAATLEARGLDFADAIRLFAGETFDRIDDRAEYGECRIVTAGSLDGRFVVIVWTLRGATRQIISMRFGHANEEAFYRGQLG